MRKIHKILLSLGVAAVIFGYFGVQALQAEGNHAPAAKVEAEKVSQGVMTKEKLLSLLPGDKVVGKEDAPITMIEYASLSCSHCAAFHKEVFPTLKERYVDTGKARYIYRDFPLNKQALRASMLAQCSGDRYFDFVKVLFKTQESWAYDKNFEEKLANIGKLGGMTGEQFDACMQNVKVQEKILDSYNQAAKLLEIKGTPALFVNGEAVTNMGQEGVVTFVDALLVKKDKK
ncbi:MAG: hypothetical protein K0R63_1358 [Rickettsiales bacterium]|jgi:protein-disulfide isomerase|nr:hypothetical protein [Rickettsiales bacterium]